MVVTVASMKGGVGKSTIAAMLARYIVDNRGSTVAVIDMDPQRGATIVLLGPQMGARIEPPTIYDVLAMELEEIPSTETFAQALRKSPYSDKIFVIPANGELGSLTEMEPPAELLRVALEASPLSQDVTVIVDTGSAHRLCELSIVAADQIFIPITLSHQTGVPTLNTIKIALKHNRVISGLIPIMVGSAKWQEDHISAWRNNLDNSNVLKAMGIDVLPSMPFSQTIVRGKWRWGKLPRRFIPTLDAMYTKLFGKSTPAMENYRQERELKAEEAGSNGRPVAVAAKVQ